MSSSSATDDPRQLSSERVTIPGLAEIIPPRAHKDSVIALLLFLASLAYLFLFRRYSAMDPDEGIVLQGAERILRGEVPYRDFFSFYTPGSFYLVAGMFRVFGDSFVVGRTSIAIVGSGLSGVTYLLARRVCSWRIALLTAGLTMTTTTPYRFLVLHNWYATFFGCLSLYSAVRLLESHKIKWAFATGSLVALTVLIEQSTGAGLCLGLMLGYVVLRFFGRIPSSQITAVWIGFIWPWIVLLLYFGSKGSLGAMLQDWVWPLHHYARSNHVFYGYQNWTEADRTANFYTGALWVRVAKFVAISPGFVMPVLPLAAVAWLTLETFQIKRRECYSSNSEYFVLLSSALSGLFLSVLMVRPDVTHFLYLAPLWNVVLAWILGVRELRLSLLRKVRPYLAAYVCIAFGAMSLALLLNVNSGKNLIETHRGVVMTKSQDTVLPYLQSHVTAGDTLLVYPYLPLYNYLTDTVSPARLDFFQPGMNTAEHAQQIIGSLQASKAHALLFEPSFAEKFASTWPNTPLTVVAHDPVGDFIVRNYHICEPLKGTSGWLFQFMVRKSDSCP